MVAIIVKIVVHSCGVFFSVYVSLNRMCRYGLITFRCKTVYFNLFNKSYRYVVRESSQIEVCFLGYVIEKSMKGR